MNKFVHNIQGDSLYKVLKKYRTQKSKERGVPAYFIMSNKVLIRIVDTMPESMDALHSVKGMGSKKISLYGKDIIFIINEYIKTKPSRVNQDTSFDVLFEPGRFISWKMFKAKFNALTDSHDNYNSYSWDELNTMREEHNNRVIQNLLKENKEYLDNILKDTDSNIILDQKQRKAVLRDEDYTLIIAGAGAGKTTTVAAKVKYLVDKQGVDPNNILLISYTNKAVNELKERINKDLNINTPVTTFHSTGNAIIRKKKNSEKTRIVRDGLMYNVIRDYLSNHIANRPEQIRNLVLFFGYYIDAPLDDKDIEKFFKKQQRTDLTTMKENIKEMNQQLIKERAKQKRTIKYEVMRSVEEVQIANFLYLNNVDYEYEAAYPYHIKHSKKLYTPDFTIKQGGKTIYLEHFGINEDGSHSHYSDEQLKMYKENIKDKIEIHIKHGTTLIYTYSSYDDERPMLEHLKESLESVGIDLKERNHEEVYRTITKEQENKYFHKFIQLIIKFINNFKRNGYTESTFDQLIAQSDNVRNRMFLKLCKPIYLYYQQFLIQKDMIDFEDMINESERILKQDNVNKKIPEFEYIIVDEYQDISQQRFDLTKRLSEITNAKIVAVGDDWQSIFAFAGSKINLFLEFKQKMGYADILKIDHTYRNAQEVIDIAGNFVQKNQIQLKKTLTSPKTIKKPVVLFEYDDQVYKDKSKGYKGVLHEKGRIIESIIEKIVHVHGEKTDIALLGRYNFEGKQLLKTEFFQEDSKERLIALRFPNVRLTFMTVHRAKGLGFTNVIVLNGEDGTFGFPSQIQTDPLLSMVIHDDKSYQYAEERRLFYVALTRTKNRVFILYPKNKPSMFLSEISQYDHVINHGSEDLSSKVPLEDRKDKRCPHCNYPLILKDNKAYGLKLYMCTNDPEICDYMTNNLKSGKESIKKCPDCETGFLIVKHSKKTGNHFFGCTNYKTNGKGCNKTEEILEQKKI